MTQSHIKTSSSRRACQLAMAAAVILTAARVIHLADTSVDATTAPPSAGSSAGGNHPVAGVPSTTATSTNAELQKLYAACPMAALVDLQTVATSPEKVDALLPPYRATADRTPHSSIDPAVPRIRYPIALRPNGAQMDAAHQTSNVRIAQAPAKPETTEKPPATNSAAVDWLVDPKEWYRPGEASSLQSGKPPTTRSATPKRAQFNQPAAHRPPVNKEWKLLTPEDLPKPASAEPVSPQPTAPAESNAAPLEPTDLALPPVESRRNDKQNLAPPEQALTAPSPNEPPPESAASTGDDAPLQLPVTEPFQPSDSTPQTESAPPNAPSVTPAPPGDEQPPIGTESGLFAPPEETLPLGTAESAADATDATDEAVDPHLELLARNAYPSARECAACHEDIYHEWSVSAHAYAAVSPMFHKFEQKLNDLTKGTIGYFCMRCHAPVATALCASRAEPIWNLPEAAREGVTCIACHRVQYVYGKSNGERRIEPGNVFAPVFGGIGGEGVAETIHRKEHFKVKTSPHEPGPGQNMHAAGIYFEPLTRSEFCTPCHQVAVHPGIKLEVVWEQYRASPACKKGIQCQDCHMGRVPGLPLGYNVGPVANVADKTVNDHRKKSNHIFYGPNYSIAHPGVFPFHLKANRWTMQEWLAFDWRAGWGTDEFEDRLAEGEGAVNFPPVWAEADDRYDAREIIDENLKKLNHKRNLRVEVLENGSHVEGPFFDSPLCRGQDIDFHFIVTNTNEGHNLLTASLGAQPQLWANVALIGPDGNRLWETGYTDSAGDLANSHSVDVRHKRLPYDWQLFNLQTIFLITGAKGTDREFPVPVNLDIDQLPFIRPGAQPISTINHPPFIRMETQSLAPLGSRRVPYRIPGHLIQQPGKYRLSFRMRSRAEPIYFMRFCDATPEMERSMNEWMIDVHPISVEFVVQ